MIEYKNITVKRIKFPKEERPIAENSKWYIIAYADITMTINLGKDEDDYDIIGKAIQTDYRIVAPDDSNKVYVFSPARPIGGNRLIPTGGGEPNQGDNNMEFTIRGQLFQNAVKTFILDAFYKEVEARKVKETKKTEEAKPTAQEKPTTTQQAEAEKPF